MLNKGLLFERTLSSKIHSSKTAVLISSQFLRKYNCGQVDIAYVENGELNLVEVKSSVSGLYSMQKTQLLRLERSAALMKSLIQIPVNLKFIAKRNSKFYP